MRRRTKSVLQKWDSEIADKAGVIAHRCVFQHSLPEQRCGIAGFFPSTFLPNSGSGPLLRYHLLGENMAVTMLNRSLSTDDDALSEVASRLPMSPLHILRPMLRPHGRWAGG